MCNNFTLDEMLTITEALKNFCYDDDPDDKKTKIYSLIWKMKIEMDKLLHEKGGNNGK